MDIGTLKNISLIRFFLCAVKDFLGGGKWRVEGWGKREVGNKKEKKEKKEKERIEKKEKKERFLCVVDCCYLNGVCVFFLFFFLSFFPYLFQFFVCLV